MSTTYQCTNPKCPVDTYAGSSNYCCPHCKFPRLIIDEYPTPSRVFKPVVGTDRRWTSAPHQAFARNADPKRGVHQLTCVWDCLSVLFGLQRISGDKLGQYDMGARSIHDYCASILVPDWNKNQLHGTPEVASFFLWSLGVPHWVQQSFPTAQRSIFRAPQYSHAMCFRGAHCVLLLRGRYVAMKHRPQGRGDASLVWFMYDPSAGGVTYLGGTAAKLPPRRLVDQRGGDDEVWILIRDNDWRVED